MFKKIFKIQFLAIALGIFLTILAFPVLAATQFEGGNKYIVSNTQAPAFGDSVNANPGDIVQFKVDIINTGSEPATNVIVKADLQANTSGNTLTSTIHVTADNSTEMSDNATVNVSASGTKSLVLCCPEHAVVVSNSGTTQIPNGAIVSGYNIGTVQPGASNYVEVTFKAQVTVQVAPTATPTPTGVQPTVTPTPTGVQPTATPTPTGVQPTPTATPIPQGSVCQNAGEVAVIIGSTVYCMTVQQYQQLQNTININNSNTNNNNNSNSINNSGNSTVQIAAAAASVRTIGTTQATTVASVAELPRTGLPLAAWALAGLFPGGLGLKKFRKGGEENSDTPNFISQLRAFKKD